MSSEPEPSAESVFDRIFTTVNPESGSEPPANMAWVIYENGTAFFSMPTEALPVDASSDALSAAAGAALRELGEARAGGPAGDFNVSRLKGWYPDDNVFFVSFAHESIATIVIADSDVEVQAGLAGRSARSADVREETIVVIRAFDGTKTRPAA